MPFEITRRLEIDAGHRIPDHGSKCRNLHGHRYVIEATCRGGLSAVGAERGMVLDFSFLKDEMVRIVDEYCDHGMILAVDDPFLPTFLPSAAFLQDVKAAVRGDGFYSALGSMGKLYVMADVPTAENLARHWFDRLAPAVRKRSMDRANLQRLTVWETPNCSAVYPA